MVEYLFNRSTDALSAARVEAWIGLPPRGPIGGSWAGVPLPDRRELTWGLATQLADLAALRAEGGPPVPMLGYVATRMAQDHPRVWDRLRAAYAKHPSGLERKVYRLAELLSGVVSTQVRAMPGSLASRPNV